jgi:glycosyltransferase involved in cell wall biosynthesis
MFSGTGLRARLLAAAGGRVEATVCRRADAVVALNGRLKERMRQDGVGEERIRVIPPGVNGAEFACDDADPFPAIPHPRVVFVGRLALQKGIETLLKAASLMRRSDAQIVIVGDGPRRAALEREVRARGLGARVRIVGFRRHSEIPQVLSHSELFCLPSRFEELSSALLEAMRAGLPIVATDVGGVPEALDGAGRLVPPDEPVALARTLDELLSDGALAARLGRLARDRSRDYEWSELATRVLDLYQAVAGVRALGSSLSRASADGVSRTA